MIFTVAILRQAQKLTKILLSAESLKKEILSEQKQGNNVPQNKLALLRVWLKFHD